MSLSPSHQPVMLNETISALNVHPEGVYLDGTFGRGGHSSKLIEKLDEKGRLICLDKDPDAIKAAKEMFGSDQRVHIIQGCFSEMATIVAKLGYAQRINGILLDLGISSPQIDTAERGFSFMRDGPLDMRMDPTQGISASEWLNSAPEGEIAHILRVYGEEPLAKRIAHKIIECRKEAPILTTLALAELVRDCTPAKKWCKQPAAKTFQAIRIHINQELAAIDKALVAASALLAVGGRLAVITFHSLEDRKIKQYFRSHSRVQLPYGIALPEKDLTAPLKWVIKRQQPSEQELHNNPRARSAILRAAEKIS